MGKDAYEKFQIAALELMSELVSLDLERRKDELGAVMYNSLFSLDGPKKLNSTLTKDETFRGKIFFGLNEIDNSYQVLCDIPVLLSRFPYKNTRITEVRYLRHNIESFLNEVYLIKERLVAYAKLIDRYYKNQELKKICEQLISLTEETLQPIVVTRGSHVHRLRYTSEEIDQLEMLDLLNRNSGINITFYYKRRYREIRKQWQSRINEINAQIKKLLDYYFQQLYPFIFDDNGKFHI